MKLISFVLCGLLVLSVGCGSNNQSGFNEDSSNALRSDKPTVNHRLVWDNATHRFQRPQLIIIKNEFVNLGIYGNEIEKCLLSDSCTDEQLMAYPNFSTKWNEYQKQFEK